MFEYQLRLGVELHKMFNYNKNIRRSIDKLCKKMVGVILQERYDPRTVKFTVMSPAGRSNTIRVVLESAEYSTAPIIEPPDHPATSSAAMAGWVDSLYKAVVGDNQEIRGFLMLCEGLATMLYAVARYIYEAAYSQTRKDLARTMEWDAYDNWITGDFITDGTMHLR